MVPAWWRAVYEFVNLDGVRILALLTVLDGKPAVAASSTDSSENGNIKPIPKTRDAIAVAIKQDDGPESVPKVVAGGKGRVAEQILEIAFSQGIKVREDADLAELLASIDIDSDIPVDAFATVAEILNYVYRVNNEMRADGWAAEGKQTGGEPGDEADDLPSAAELVRMWAQKGSDE